MTEVCDEGHSERVAENRRKILEAASRLFRARGFEAVTVAEIMQAAGLTHGGFYGHFKSKDDLIAQTLADALWAQIAGRGRSRPLRDERTCHQAIATTSPAAARRRGLAPRPFARHRRRAPR